MPSVGNGRGLAFYERRRPWASVFMALFGREGLPSRSALSRWLAALDQTTGEALRAFFLADLPARPLGQEQQTGRQWDHACSPWLVFEIDGT